MNRSKNDKKTHKVTLFLTHPHHSLQKRDRVFNNPIIIAHSQQIVHLMHKKEECQ